MQQQGMNIIENIMNITGSPKSDNVNFSQNDKNVYSDESSTEQEQHDKASCSCHVPEHFALDLIESKDVLLPLIKKWISAIYWMIFYLCCN